MNKILLLAPQPFYTERGTPIAVLNMMSALSELGYSIDLLTFPRGSDVSLENTTIYRVGAWLPLPEKLPVGFSFRKLILDFVMLFKAISLCRKNQYIVLHGVEEAAFVALGARLLSRQKNRPKIIYDMDSSMSDQLVERWPSLSVVHKLFDYFESFAVRRSDHILAVCQALKEKCEQHVGHAPITVIEDICDNRSPSLSTKTPDTVAIDDLSTILPAQSEKLLYVGNLEHYQGVGLVLEAMAEHTMPETVGFIIIGGRAEDIQRYQQQADSLGISDKVAFLGPRPVEHLLDYLKQADILISPRLKGVNTPMKIYTYLSAGKAIVATNITSHTQVLTPDNACLVDPTPLAAADGIRSIIDSNEYRDKIGQGAKNDAESHYSYARFKERVAALYKHVLT